MRTINNRFSLSKKQKFMTIVCFIIIIIAAIYFHQKLWNYNTQTLPEDIYYLWIEGKRLLSRENPYARILLGNVRVNDKYATYFPLFYILSYLTQLLGWINYSEWINLWRHVFLFFNLSIAGLLFYCFYKIRLFILAIFAASFWLFDRWTLHVTKIAHMDFMPIFFLILSLIIFQKHKYTSLILFSISLAFKQIAVFLLPLYLIWIWQAAETEKAKKTLIAFSIILSIPFLTSLPFILWNAEGFVKSILFSATRNPDGHFNAPSMDAFIRNVIPEFVGIKAKIPMLFLMALIYLSVLMRKIGMYTSTLMTMFTFLDFNSVLFTQYFCWVVPFIPLTICDFFPNSQQISKRMSEK